MRRAVRPLALASGSPMVTPAVVSIVAMMIAPSAVYGRHFRRIAVRSGRDHIARPHDRLGLEHHIGDRSRVGLDVGVATAAAATTPTAVEQAGRRTLHTDR